MTGYAASVGSSVVVALALLAGCGQKGALIAAKRPAATASATTSTIPAATAPLPPPEPLEPPIPGTAPR